MLGSVHRESRWGLVLIIPAVTRPKTLATAFDAMGRRAEMRRQYNFSRDAPGQLPSHGECRRGILRADAVVKEFRESQMGETGVWVLNQCSKGGRG